MQTEIIISGFGGQGVLFAGQLLAYAALDLGREVTWLPSYGPEMRGGTANCTVIIADEEIGSPAVRHPQVALVLNLPSMDKYEDELVSGGTLIANASLINRGVHRMDIKSLIIPANEIAEALGNKRMTNMVMLGAMLGMSPVMPLEALEKTLELHLPERHRRLLPANFKALRQGFEFAQKQFAQEILSAG
jgi:2-oxoglutarate ferredoxin oxidoreductase subunit gamma